MHELATCSQSERIVQSMKIHSSPVLASGPAACLNALLIDKHHGRGAAHFLEALQVLLQL